MCVYGKLLGRCVYYTTARKVCIWDSYTEGVYMSSCTEGVYIGQLHGMCFYLTVTINVFILNSCTDGEFI